MTESILFIIIMKKNMYVILKHLKLTKTKKKVPVILLNGQNEIWEFKNFEDAEKMKDIFEKNSDSDHKYEVKKI